jgi:uncharacterized membrane protein SirB2
MSIKLIHITCAVLTFFLFSLRGVWMLEDSPVLQHKLVRISPHVIDTCLLITGLTMALSLYAAFYTQPWLMAKLLALVLYIVIGSIALKYGKTKKIRTCALIVALVIFLYIVMVALTHSPIPYII